MTAATKKIGLDRPFAMRRGGCLHDVEIAYETWGKLDDAHANAVLLFTGLSPSAHAVSSPADPAPGWWEDMIGSGKPIDTDRFFVVCINSLGSCFGSTGPASTHPDDGQPYRLRFPLLTLEDIAAAGHEVMLHLDIARVHAVVGASMGGMTALAYCLLYPDAARSLVSLSSATRSLPFSIALRSLQREMIRSDTAWKGGAYTPGRGPLRGMRLARKLGMITYRSAEEWRERFGRERVSDGRRGNEPFGIEFEVESYLEAHAQRFTGNFDANCYLYLSRAMDLFDVAEHGGSLAAGMATLKLESALVIGVVTDFLFPPHQQQQLADLLEAPGRQVTLHMLPSIQGHDSFLVDMDRFRPAMAAFFD